MYNKKIVGSALIEGTLRQLILIDSRYKEDDVRRVVWLDPKGRRVTSFISPTKISELF